jgi:hypothetical protein
MTPPLLQRKPGLSPNFWYGVALAVALAALYYVIAWALAW